MTQKTMKQRYAVIVMYDAPSEIDGWMHGDHYDQVKNTPGVVEVRRYELVSGPDGARKYMAVIETEDIDATREWRDSVQGKRSQAEANERGVSNRYSVVSRRIY